MAFPQRSVAMVALLLCACEQGDREASHAVAVVGRFEQALRAHDRIALREIVTFESRAALASLPNEGLAAKQPLRVLDAVRKAGALHVRVRDPNAGDREGEFVVVRENGKLRVDLVASAGLTARDVPLPGAATRTVVRPLSPTDRARVAAHAPASR